MAKDEPPSTTVLPLAVKAAHGIGAAANGALLYLRSLILLFYSQVVGLDPAVVGLVMALSIMLDAIWDPAIGHFSDNLRSRLGRRHLLMLLSPLPTGILVAMFWNPPMGWTLPETLGWFTATLLLLNLSYSFFEVPSNALTPELAPGYHQRTNLVAWRWVLGTFGALFCSVIGLGYFLKPKAGEVGQLIREGYGHLGLAVAVFCIASMLLNWIGTLRQSRNFYAPPERDLPLLTSLREAWATLRSGNMAVALTAGGLTGIGFGIRTVLEAYIATYIWSLPAAAFMWIGLASYLSAPLGAIVAGVTGRAMGKKAACMTLFFVGTVIVNLPLLLRLLGLFIAPGSASLLPVLVGFAFVGGVLNYGGFILVSSMIADIVEEAEERTGRRSEGLITAADQFIQKLITALGTALGGVILTLIAFPRQAVPGKVPAATLDALGWWFLALAAVLSFASIATWKFYSIDKSAHERRLRAFAANNMEGAA